MLTRFLVLLFVATFTASAQSQPPAPRGANANGVAQNQSANQREQPPIVPTATQPPIALNLSVAPTVVTNGPRADQDSDSSSTAADWWMVGLTAVGTAAAIILVVLALNQFATQTKQTKDALKLAADGLEATREAIGRQPRKLLRQSSDTTGRWSWNTLRDWQSGTSASLKPIRWFGGGKTIMKDLTDEISGTFVIANIGRNKALIESIYSQWVIGKLPMRNPSEGAMGDEVNLSLPAGYSIPVESRPGKIDYGKQADGSISLEDENDLSGILDRKTPVYLIGWVAYTDTSGGHRRTMFCRQFNYKTGRFKPVNDPDYNYKN